MKTNTSYKLTISGKYFDDSPIWWRQFIEHVEKRTDDNGKSIMFEEILVNEFNGVHCPNRMDRELDYILFPDEESAVVFLLRWG